MNERRGAWHLLTGVLIGIALGLVFSLFILPVQYVDTDPSTLRQEERDVYRGLIARAYLVEGDTPRALARLALLQDGNPMNAIVEQAQGLLGEGGDENLARALALLAAAQSQPSALITPLPRNGAETFEVTETTAEVSPSPTVEKPTKTPRATVTPRPTFAPSPTLGNPFYLQDRKEVCNPKLTPGLLMVFIKDAQGNGVPGIKVEVSLPAGGFETFYTGFYPEVDPGYADYVMTVGMTYNLRVSDNSDLEMGISIPDCINDQGEHYPGAIRLNFRQP